MKKNRARRIAALISAAALMTGVFAGCKGDDGGNGGGSGSGKKEEETPEFVYVPNYIDVEGDFDGIGEIVYGGGKFYFTSWLNKSVDPDGNELSEEDENYWEYYTSEQAVYSMNDDGTDIKQLENYEPLPLPEGSQGSSYMQGLKALPDGSLFAVECVYAYHYDAPEGVTSEDDEYWNYYVDDGTQYMIRTLDPTGAEISRIDVSDIFDENGLSSDIAVDGDGNIYMTDGNTGVYVLDSTGAELFTLSVDNWVNSFCVLNDEKSTVAVLCYGGSGYVAKLVDTAARDWGEDITLPSNCNYVRDGYGDYLFYGDDCDNYYGYNAATSQWEKVLNWINCDINGNNIVFTGVDDDGNTICAVGTYGSDGYELEIVGLVKTPYDQVEHKTVLTYACMYLNYNLRAEIINFNKANGKYRIEVKDYSEYNTEDDDEAGLTKLTTEIVSGNVPDILDTDSLPIEQYAAKGLLEDLYPYIDADPELSREDIVPSVLETLEIDGKLYQVGSAFEVMTLAGSPDVLGPESGWTVDELMSLIAAHPEATDPLGVGETRDTVLDLVCRFAMNDYVDWETGKCDFDNESFISLLEFVNTFPAEFDWDSYDYELDGDTPEHIASGRQLMMEIDISNFRDFQMYKAMFGGDIVYKGFPDADRDGNAMQLMDGIAMTSSCADKDGAWEFIRTLLTKEYQEDENEGWAFPTNQEAFDELLKEAMTPKYTTDPETGEQVEQSQGGWSWGDLSVDIYAVTQEDADKILETINGVHKLYSYDNSVMDIITDEAQEYFNGTKTAADCAALIQSRVNIYVNEQK